MGHAETLADFPDVALMNDQVGPLAGGALGDFLDRTLSIHGQYNQFTSEI